MSCSCTDPLHHLLWVIPVSEGIHHICVAVECRPLGLHAASTPEVQEVQEGKSCLSITTMLKLCKSQFFPICEMDLNTPGKHVRLSYTSCIILNLSFTPAVRNFCI